MDISSQEKNKKAPEETKKNPYISNMFKLWIVGVIFVLMFIHLFSITRYGPFPIISDETIVSIVLALVGYLWIQELRDRYRLQTLNKALVEAQERLKREELEIIAALVLTEEAKDPYVRGHSKRVTKCAIAIARKVGFSGAKQMVLERASILHDLGKLDIVDQILRKRGKLTDAEWGIIRKHPQRAVEMLEPLKFLAREREIIYHHHEWYDGKGYPQGLKGEDIPIESRIISVADAFDAMNSDSAYRRALPGDVIISRLKEASGNQLDPLLVDVFLDLIEKDLSLWSKD